MTWRRLAVLVRALPRESSTTRSMVGPSADWGAIEHLLATVADVLIMANSSAKRRPKLIERPGGRRKVGGDKRYTPAQIDRLFAAAEKSAEFRVGEVIQ